MRSDVTAFQIARSREDGGKWHGLHPADFAFEEEIEPILSQLLATGFGRTTELAGDIDGDI